MSRKNWIEILDIALSTIAVGGILVYFVIVLPIDGLGDIYILFLVSAMVIIISVKTILEQAEANLNIAAGGNEIRSNNIRKCLRCGCPITSENDSGWEAFTGDGFYTQSLCKDCNEKESNLPGLKVE